MTGKQPVSITHFGDPCIHCGTPHDDVATGDCKGEVSDRAGELKNAIPVAWCSLGVRWDNVEHYRILFSDGSVRERWAHIDMRLPFCNFGYEDHFPRPGMIRYDANFRRHRN